MRNLRQLDHYRKTGQDVIDHWGWTGDETCGAFVIPSPIDHASLLIIASQGEDWDHISVSRANRCPNWPEMEYIKRMFFKDDETAMQLHVPATDHINVHPYCLHLWRPQSEPIPRPPPMLVGPVTANKN